MDPIELELDVRPVAWSTNQDRRMNPYKRAETIALWKQAAFIAYRGWKVRNNVADYLPGKAIVTLTIPFDDNRTRDPHNYCGTVLKAVVDGLVKAKAFPDDTFEFAGHREPVLVVSPEKPSIRIEIEEERQHERTNRDGVDVSAVG